METKSDSLLSKVASFFREKGADEDAQPSQKSSRAMATQATPKDKDQAKLKRHDDAIREREFKGLRSIIKTQRTAQGLSDQDPPRPSLSAPSSTLSTNNRASTLQKINVAEAQLEHWWGGTPSKPSKPLVPAAPAPAAPASNAPAALDDDFDLDFTDLTPLAQSASKLVTTPAPAPEPMALEFDMSDLTFTPSQEAEAEAESESATAQSSVLEAPPASQIEECLRDAAICYSEGDYGKSEELLLAMLKSHCLDASEVELLTFALFDVYRATGEHSRFEVTALDYAERVGRSPAEWFSIPERLAAQTVAADAASAPSAPASKNATWKCPATLNNTALAQLQIEIGDSPSCRIDWSGLSKIEPAAAPTLEKLVRQWCTTPAKLEWSGMNALKQSLGMHTHQASSCEDELWWRMHMDILCILQLSEEFESLALDYCVAFEVSPPNPTPVQCTLVEDTPDAPLDFDSLFDTPAPAAAPQTPSAPANNANANASGVATCALIGDLCGDATQALQSLRHAAEKAQLLTVSCALLRRIDFTAANAIFNWTKTREAGGTQIHFTQVPRLVLIFLLMLGLEKHATLSMRNL
jgi:ABC-type transporter Mla MlaB component